MRGNLSNQQYKHFPFEIICIISSYLDPISLIRSTSRVSKPWRNAIFKSIPVIDSFILDLDSLPSLTRARYIYSARSDDDEFDDHDDAYNLEDEDEDDSLLEFEDLMNDEIMTNLAPFLVNTKEISLNGCINISDESLDAITAHCAALEVLELDSCFNITDDGLRTVSRLSHCLRVLDIGHCTELTQHGLDATLPSLTNLTQLDVSQAAICSLDFLKPLARLTSLSLAGCDKISSEHLTEGIAHLTKLTSLNLSFTQIQYFHAEKLFSTLTNITELYLCACFELGGIGALVASPLAPQVQQLDLSGSFFVAWDVPEALRQLPALKWLNLSNVQQLSSSASRDVVAQLREEFRNRMVLIL